jgi:hypothetical protein
VEPQVLKYSYRFKNVGDKTLEISNVKPGCGCTVVPDYDKKVEPGKEGTIKIELNATTYKGHVEKGIEVTSNDMKEPSVHLTLAAEIKVDLGVYPNQNIWMGRLAPDTATNQTLEIKGALPEALVIDKVETTVPWLAAEITSSTTNSAKLQVSTKPPLPFGQNHTSVTVFTKYGKYTNLVVNVTFHVPSTISTMPSFLLFPKTQEKVLALNVMRNDGKEFHITSIKLPSPLLKSQVTTNTAGRSYKIDVTYTPTDSAQPADGKVEILTDEPSWPKVEVPCSFK